MKTIRIFTMAAAALILAACGNEEFIENVENGAAEQLVPMTFTANMPQTRTYLSGGTNVHWSKGDEIALWDNTDKRKFTATEIDGSSATFTGMANSNYRYAAFYPYSAVKARDGVTFTFTLPAKQTAKWKSFANNLAPSFALVEAPETNLQFKNVCALVKFYIGLSAIDVKTVSLVARNGEVLAGDLKYKFTDESVVGAESNTSSRIDLSGPFEPAIDYYFVVRPCTLAEGFSLLVEYNDGTLKRTEVRKPVTLKAGQILDIGAPKNLGPYISQAILPEGMGTPNGDGSVTLSELDLIALEEIERLDLSNKGLTNLYGIEVYSNLKYLTCNDNPGLTKIDVRKLTKLETLRCERNALTELNVTGLSNLQVLSCSQNQLTTLDVSGLTNLRTLSCSSNKLSELNLTGLTSLEIFYCRENWLSSLDITMLPALTTLRCGSQKEGSIWLRLVMTQEQYTTMWPYNEGFEGNEFVTPSVKK
ncbi:conserved repeat protein [Bacteroides sp. CAG:598]|mgnify:CR=1 FL=1|nr:conserved repeat protein [Bacteroides sp. CAG:598]